MFGDLRPLVADLPADLGEGPLPGFSRRELFLKAILSPPMPKGMRAPLIMGSFGGTNHGAPVGVTAHPELAGLFKANGKLLIGSARELGHSDFPAFASNLDRSFAFELAGPPPWQRDVVGRSGRYRRAYRPPGPAICSSLACNLRFVDFFCRKSKDLAARACKVPTGPLFKACFLWRGAAHGASTPSGGGPRIRCGGRPPLIYLKYLPSPGRCATRRAGAPRFRAGVPRHRAGVPRSLFYRREPLLRLTAPFHPGGSAGVHLS
jgi:hypothetical protein